VINRWAAFLWPAAVLALVVTSACALSLYWVFLVPIFESPDEQVHADYAFSLFRAGGLITVRDGSPGSGNPYVPWLVSASGAERIKGSTLIKAPPGYGTAAYYASVDAGAPSLNTAPEDIPYQVARYPFGYFALSALWLAIVSPAFGSGPVELFFEARAFNVLLLAIGLVACYAVLRRLKFGPGRSLAITAAIGFFPMVTFVASYIQQDNLGFALIPVLIYLAGLVARRPTQAASLAAGVALAALLLTKYQFFVAAGIPIAGYLFTQLRAGRRWLRLLPALALPTVAAGLTQAWISVGSSSPFIVHTLAPPGVWSDVGFRHALAGGPGTLSSFVVGGIAAACGDFFGGGTVYQGFWGAFGWQGARLGFPPLIGALAAVGILVLVITIATLSLWRMSSIGLRLIVITRHGHRRAALRIAFSNPLLNTLFVFEAFMLAFYVYTGNTFFAQGRDWMPFMLPLVVLGTWYAPRALPWRPARSALSGMMLAGWLGYALLGSWYAVPTVKGLYYGNGRSLAVVSVASLRAAANDGIVYGMDRLDTGLPPNPLAFPHWYEITTIGVSGWAADTLAHAPVGTVFVTVDDDDYQAVYGDDRPDIALQMGGAYLRTGFDIVVQLRNAAPGTHYLTLKIVSADLSSYWEPPQRFAFEIPALPGSGAADERGLITP
jgi:hypothetical protein